MPIVRSLRRLINISILFTIVGVVSCTGRSSESAKMPDKNQAGQPSGRRGDRASPGDSAEKVASAQIVITENDVKKAAPKDNLNLSDLQYKATYQEVVVGSGAMTFKDGKAVILLTSLPANQPGDFKLEILAADKPKLTAEVPAVALPPDTVTPVAVSLTPAGDASPAGGAAGANSNTNTSSSTGTSSTTSPIPSPGTGGNVEPPKPLASPWDGKSDRGNQQWKIVPAN